MHVANVTRLASKELNYYKIHNLYLINNGKEIRTKKTVEVSKRLEKGFGIEVVNVSQSKTTCRSSADLVTQ